MSSVFVSKWSLHGHRDPYRDPRLRGSIIIQASLYAKGQKKKKKERENVEILYVLPGKENVGTTYLLLLGNAILLTFHDHTA